MGDINFQVYTEADKVSVYLPEVGLLAMAVRDTETPPSVMRKANYTVFDEDWYFYLVQTNASGLTQYERSMVSEALSYGIKKVDPEKKISRMFVFHRLSEKKRKEILASHA